MAPQGSSPDGFSREVQLFCVALGRVVAVSDLCLPVIPKRRSGQLAPSNNNPERSNDPLSASWELSRSPSGKTRGPSRHDQFARTKQIGTTLPLCNRRHDQFARTKQIGTTLPLCNRRPFGVA